jgi:hypothetical protein
MECAFNSCCKWGQTIQVDQINMVHLVSHVVKLQCTSLVNKQENFHACIIDSKEGV